MGFRLKGWCAPAFTGVVHAVAGAVVLSVPTGLVRAQSAPAMPSPGADPSVLLRNGARPPLATEPSAPKPSLSAPERPQPSVAAAAEVRFVLQRVEVPESRLLPAATLASAWQAQLGQEVTLADVKAIVARINALYWDGGHYAAQATLPAQKIAGGVLKLQLVEGVVDKVSVESTDPGVVRWAERVMDLQPGELLVGPELQSRLARFNRGSDTRFYAALRPGQKPGTTEVISQVDLQPRLDLAASLHNEASDTLGRNQIDLSAYGRRLLTAADRLGAIVQQTQGSTNALMLYSLPVHASGTRLGASLSEGRTHTTDSGLGQLQVKGRSTVYGFSLTQPLAEWRGLEADVSLNGQQIKSSTQIEGFALGEATTRLQSLGLQTVYRSPAHLVSAYTAFNQAHYQGADGLKRNVRSFTSSGSWAWAASDPWWVNTRFGLQFTPGVDVPSTMKFSLGNPGDVRGYPSSVVFGDDGWYLSLEGHRRFEGNIDAFAFFDNGSTTTQGVPRQTLSSVGLGAAKSWTNGWTLSGSLAHALKDAVPGQSSVRVLVRLTWQFQ